MAAFSNGKEVLQTLQSEHTNHLDVSSSRGHWHFEESRNGTDGHNSETCHFSPH
jgi:hypothetical protein